MSMNSSTATPVIEIKDLTKTYWNDRVEIPAVRGVDLRIQQGEFVALMGPSGSGKSTLMNLLAFLDVPSSGTYRFAGQNIVDFDEDYLASLRNATIGFVFKQFHLLARTSALDNVRLPLQYAGVPKSEQIQRATAALQQVGLGNRLDHMPNQLSGGQQQGVSIARAIVNGPTLLFCDEPTGNLDSASSLLVMELLADIHKMGNTVIFVTHNPELTRYATRVVYMHDGQVIYDEKIQIGKIAQRAKKAFYNLPTNDEDSELAGVSALMKGVPEKPARKTRAKKTKTTVKRRKKTTKASAK